MSNPDVLCTEAVAALRAAERRYGEAESDLIAAQRAVAAARVGTHYYRAVMLINSSLTNSEKT